MDAPHSPPEPDSSPSCPRCGAALECGSMTRPFDCWCARLPALPGGGALAREAGGAALRCLCPRCYADELAAGGAAAGGDIGQRPHSRK
ncbi:hypothetical protein C0Z18_12015 [Trinickia dabaoshanensis]|uniref:Cysteine-rich CWC family protein n=1 Tax=Trinickia dabaoshanensis TaxID=564714 RepID=A0A2N7VSJ0_9BURK|nr:cysteine-rich CWC family protein [Trinickia dabaoshanensis]PMS20124.1 hypothetical protein C0Z18_12015 [Trinickia dabaoshanensis]